VGRRGTAKWGRMSATPRTRPTAFKPPQFERPSLQRCPRRSHLVDSQILAGIFDAVIPHHSSFECRNSASGAPTRSSPPPVESDVASVELLDGLLEAHLLPRLFIPKRNATRFTRPADKDGCAPEISIRRRTIATYARSGRTLGGSAGVTHGCVRHPSRATTAARPAAASCAT